jgi:hypothetical protein
MKFIFDGLWGVQRKLGERSGVDLKIMGNEVAELDSFGIWFIALAKWILRMVFG